MSSLRLSSLSSASSPLLSSSVPVSDSHSHSQSFSPGPDRADQRLLELGYRRVFQRSLSAIDSLCASLGSVSFVPTLFAVFPIGFTCGGPSGMIWDFGLVTAMALVISLLLSEICSAYPVSGGIFFWAQRLGGPRYGPVFGWLTGYWNALGWIATASSAASFTAMYVLTLAQILGASDESVQSSWLQFGISSSFVLLAWILNVIDQRCIQWLMRIVSLSYVVQYLIYVIWLPLATPSHNSLSDLFSLYINGTGYTGPGEEIYVRLLGCLAPAFIFTGYECSSLLSEETVDAQQKAARGIWTSVLIGFVFCLPQLIVLLYSIPDFDALFTTNLLQPSFYILTTILGQRVGAVLVIVQCLSAVSAITIVLLAAGRMLFSVSRDSLLPFSPYFHYVDSTNRLPIRTVSLAAVASLCLLSTSLFSSVAFSALTSMGTVSLTMSYFFPIFARITIGRKKFEQEDRGPFYLGRLALWLGPPACIWTLFLFTILLLPTSFPITWKTFNFAPIICAAFTLCLLIGWQFWGKYQYQYQYQQRSSAHESVQADDKTVD